MLYLSGNSVYMSCSDTMIYLNVKQAKQMVVAE